MKLELRAQGLVPNSISILEDDRHVLILGSDDTCDFYLPRDRFPLLPRKFLAFSIKDNVIIVKALGLNNGFEINSKFPDEIELPLSDQNFKLFGVDFALKVFK